MAEIYYNEKQHLIIRIDVKEATKLNFGIPVTGLNNICLCGSCNNECKPEDIYYIAGINETMCKDCVEDFVENMNHYVDDDSLKYEVEHFNNIASFLDMNERVALTPNGKCVIYNKQDIEHYINCYT